MSADHFLVQKLQEILRRLHQRPLTSTSSSSSASSNSSTLSLFHPVTEILAASNSNRSSGNSHNNASVTTTSTDVGLKRDSHYDGLVESSLTALSNVVNTSRGSLASSSSSVDKFNSTLMVSTLYADVLDQGNSTDNTTFVYGHPIVFSHRDGHDGDGGGESGQNGSSSASIFGVELTTEGDRAGDQFGFHRKDHTNQNSLFPVNYNDDDTLLKNLQEFIQVLKMSLGSPKSVDLLPPGGKTVGGAGAGGGGGGMVDSANGGVGSFSMSHGRDMTFNLTMEDITDLNNLMDDPNASMPFKHILIIVSYFLIACISIIGNLLVVQLVIRSRRLHTLTHCLLANLAVADLLMATLNIPFSAARVILVEWPFGSLLCRLVPLVQVTSVYVTSITMAVIAVDRYQVIMNPLNRRMKNSQGVLIVLAIWSLSAFLSLPYALYHKVVTVLTVRVVNRCQADFTPSIPLQPKVHIVIYWHVIVTRLFWWSFYAMARRWLTVATVLAQYVAPLAFTTASYVSIMMRLRLRSSGLGSTTPRQIAAQSRAKRKTIKMLVLTVIFFAVCWAPINSYHLLTHFYLVPHNSTAILICHLIAMSSTCYNPFIYCWLNEHFRMEALKWLRCFTTPTRRSPLVHLATQPTQQNEQQQHQLQMQELQQSENCPSNSTDNSRRCGVVVHYGARSTDVTLNLSGIGGGGGLATHSPGGPGLYPTPEIIQSRLDAAAVSTTKHTTNGDEELGAKSGHEDHEKRKRSIFKIKKKRGKQGKSYSDGSDTGSMGTDGPFCVNTTSQSSEPSSQCTCKCNGQESADCMV